MKPMLYRCISIVILVVMLFYVEGHAQPLGGEPEIGARPKRRPPRNEKLFSLLGVARARHKKAQIYEEQGKIDLAIAEMRKVLELDIPKNRKAHEVKLYAYNYIADLYLKANQGNKALETINEALKDVPENSLFAAKLYLTMGEIYRRLGQDDKALEAFDKAIANNEQLMQKGGEPLPKKD
jgi:tetratricopeptide (TPR) repeat protein